MKKIISTLLAIVMIVSMLSIGNIVASAAISYETVNLTPNETDSHEAYRDIQLQLNKMQALNSDKSSTAGLKLVITPGTYKIDTGLKIYSNTELDLTGVTLVRDTNLEGKTMISVGQQGVAGDPATGYDYYRNIQIIGGTLDSSNITGSILKFHHTSNLLVEGTVFQNCSKYHDVGFAGCDNITFNNCTFKDHNKVFTSTSSSYDNLEAIQLDILQEYHFPNLNPACYDGLTCKNINVTNCNFDNVYRGVGCHSVYIGKYMTGVNISSNTFNNVLGYAVIASNFIGTKINNNTITNCGSGILYRSYLPSGSNTYVDSNAAPKLDTGSSISNNTITITNKTDPSFIQWRYGIQVYGEKITTATNGIQPGDYRANKVTVKNNQIAMKVKGMPIWLRGVTNSTITKNTISQSVAYASGDSVINQGICADKCYNDTISENTITGAYKIQNGVQLKRSTGMKIVSNSISKAKENGILLLDGSAASAKTNTIKYSTQNGIRVYKDCKISTNENKISSSGQYGIFLVNTNKSNTINKDTITDSKKYGINLQGSNATIKNAVVKTSGSYGIYLTQKAVATITKVNVTSNKDNGIYVTNSSKATVSESTVQSNKGNGLYFTNKGYGSVKKTKILKNGKYGIYKTGTAGKVSTSGNTYKSNKSGKVH